MYDDRIYCCACTFMDTIFVIGGSKKYTSSKSCLQFNTKENSWKEVARMEEARSDSACAVFEERIVVSGGYDNDFNDLYTVESYHVAADSWSPMPSMIQRRRCHSLVVVKNKLFVIGGLRTIGSCDVFESISNKFVPLKCPYLFCSNKALSIRSKIFIFQNNESFVVIYDVCENKWSDELCEATTNLYSYSCVELPIY